MSIQGFEQATKSLAEANGISLELAGRCMAKIGDTPDVVDIDKNGKMTVEVAIDGKILRLRLS